MPQIRQFVSTKAQQGLQPSDLAVRGAEEEGRVVGEAVSGIGRSVGGAINVYEEKKNASDLTNAYSDISQAQVDLYQAGETAVKTGDPNDENLIGDWASNSLHPAQEKILEKYSGASDEVQNKIRMELVRQSSELQMHLHGVQSEIAGKAAVANSEAGTDSLSALAAQNPAQLPTLLAQSDRATAAMAGAVPAALLPAEAANRRSKISYVAAESVVQSLAANPNAQQSDVNALRAQITDPQGPYAKNLTGEQLNAITKKLDGIGNTQQGVQNALIKQQFPLMMTAIDNGAPTDQAEQALATYTANAKTKEEIVDASAMRRDLDYHKQFGGVIQTVKQLPDAEIDSKLADVRSQWSAATTDEQRNALKATEAAIIKARGDRDREFKADPAAYTVQNDPVTQARAQAFAKQPNAQNFAAMATASEAFQRRLYPSEVPKYATQGMKDAISPTIQALQSDPKATGPAGNALAELANLTGSRWIQVAHELHDDKILNDDQFVAASVYQKPAARVLANTLLQASAMNGQDLYRLHGISFEKAEAAAIPELQNLAQSMGNTGPQGAALIAANVGAVARLMQVRGSLDEAPQLAASIINNEFNFRGRNGSTTLRIPNRPDLDPDKIQQGTDDVLRNIGSANLVVPPSLSGLGASDQRKNYVDRLQHDAVWYTNKDGSGAILTDIDGGEPVREMVTPNFNYKTAAGMKAAGNLNPWTRPVLHNPDGSYSTTSSMSIGTDKGETLIPTVVDGKRLSSADAIAHFRKTGENFGTFDTPANADKFATALHNAQATMYDSHGNPLSRPVERKWSQLTASGPVRPAGAIGSIQEEGR